MDEAWAAARGNWVSAHYTKFGKHSKHELHTLPPSPFITECHIQPSILRFNQKKKWVDFSVVSLGLSLGVHVYIHG